MKNKIIDNVLSRSASLEEAREVAEWFATEEGGEYLSMRYDREAYLLNDELVSEWAGDKVESGKMKGRLISWMKSRRHNFRFRFAAAVLIPALLVIGGLTFALFKAGVVSPAQLAVVEVPFGEQMHVILQDGTRVQLNSGSRLTYPKSFSILRRDVSLSGEAYFSVEKDHSRPFYVNVGPIAVKVTGTKFNVKAYNDDSNIRVTLEEGSVSIMNDGQHLYAMKVNQSAIIDKSTISLKVEDLNDLNSIMAWRSRGLNFYRTPLSDILKVLERQYDVNFIVNDPSILKYKFSISTSKTNVRNILQDLEKVSDVRFRNSSVDDFEVYMQK